MPATQSGLANPTIKTLTPERFSYCDPAYPAPKRAAIRLLERAGGQRRLWRLYEREVMARWHEGACIFDLGIKALKLDLAYDKVALAAIPQAGPLVFIANHPYGVLDGVAFAALTRIVRPDVKIMAHSLLAFAEPARPNLLPIDFSGTPEAAQATLRSRIEAQKHLKAGGAVGIFPGGGIATSLKPYRGPVAELPWHRFTAKLIQGAQADVVPFYFPGQNSRLFQMASHLSHTLRLSMIFRETRLRMGSRLEVGIGAPIGYSELAHLSDRTSLTNELRRRTLSLGGIEPDHTFNFPRHMRL